MFRPAFCLWLPATELNRDADRLEAALAGLPAVFEGIAVRMRPQLRQGRVGPLSIEDFYARFTNLTRPPASWKEWRLIPENFLAVATNGEIFHDPSGRFTAHREALLAFTLKTCGAKKSRLVWPRWLSPVSTTCPACCAGAKRWPPC
mgnify:CR=1 FL=1